MHKTNSVAIWKKNKVIVGVVTTSMLGLLGIVIQSLTQVDYIYFTLGPILSLVLHQARAVSGGPGGACRVLNTQANLPVSASELGVDLLLIALMFEGLRQYPSTGRWTTWYLLYNQVKILFIIDQYVSDSLPPGIYMGITGATG